jgi:hypothetical protein
MPSQSVEQIHLTTPTYIKGHGNNVATTRLVAGKDGIGLALDDQLPGWVAISLHGERVCSVPPSNVYVITWGPPVPPAPPAPPAPSDPHGREASYRKAGGK